MPSYALMQRSDQLDATYARSPAYLRAPAELAAIRAALPGITPTSYRGIGRYPFTEYAEKGPGWQGQGRPEVDPEHDARSLFLKFLGAEDYETPYPRAFLREIDQATAVYAALASKELYEVVEISRPSEQPQNLLGFDIGYWGGGNFSILCDAVIWPLWHPPDLAALPDLKRYLALNRHALFSTEQAAQSYFDWYVSQPWAEEEPSDFSVMAVGAVELVTS
ncbi:MAG TPA: hypothetical protein VHO25_13890 [Polyangiaceae bacterium]|nr:hypothetical protein [Polyangiaceae bacterium]